MKGIILVLFGLFSLYTAWKIVTLSRKGAPKEVKNIPSVNTEYRKQSSDGAGVVAPKTKSGDGSSDKVVQVIPDNGACNISGDIKSSNSDSGCSIGAGLGIPSGSFGGD